MSRAPPPNRRTRLPDQQDSCPQALCPQALCPQALLTETRRSTTLGVMKNVIVTPPEDVARRVQARAVENAFGIVGRLTDLHDVDG